MWLFTKVILSIALTFFTSLKEQFHDFDKNTLIERLNKKTPFFSLDYSQKKNATDLSGIGFLGDMDDDSAEKEPCLEEAHQTPTPPSHALIEDTTSQKKTPPKPVFIETDPMPDPLPQIEDVQPEACNNETNLELQSDDLPDRISPLHAFTEEKASEKEDPPKHYLIEIDSIESNSQAVPAPEENNEKDVVPTFISVENAPSDTDKSSSEEHGIADKDFTEKALNPLEACYNLQQVNNLKEDCSKEPIHPRANDLSGILVMHFQAMIQISKMLSRRPIYMPCNLSKEPPKKNTLFLKAVGSYFNQGRRPNLLGFTSQIYGTTLGIEHSFSNRWRGKGAAGYSYSQLHWDKGHGKTFLHSIYFGGFFGYFGEKGYAQAHILGARSLYRIQRDLYCQDISSKHWGWDLSMGFNGGVPIYLKKFLLVPEAEFAYLNSFEEKYQKQCSLSARRSYASLFHQEVSIRLVKDFLVKKVCISPSFRTGYARDSFLNDYRYTFRVQEKWTLKGFHKSMNFFILEALATLSLHSSLQLNVGYETKLGAHSQIHEGKVGLFWSF